MLPKAKSLLLVYLFVLGLAGVFLLFSHEGFANRLINYSFLLLVISVIAYLKEVKNEK